MRRTDTRLDTPSSSAHCTCLLDRMQAGTDLRRPRAEESPRQQWGQQGEGAVASWEAGVAEVAVEKDADFLTGFAPFRTTPALLLLEEDEDADDDDDDA